MGGDLPDDVLQDVACDNDPPNHYGAWNPSVATTKLPSSQYAYASSEYIDPTLLYDTTFVDPCDVEYGVNPVVHAPYIFHTRGIEDLQAHGSNDNTSSTYTGEPWAEYNTRTGYSHPHQFQDSQSTADIRSDGSLHRRVSWGSLHVEPDESYSFDNDLYTFNPPRFFSKTDQEEEAAVPDVLVCNYAGCKVTFTGAYRKGNQARHIKLKHHPANDSFYPCEVETCHHAFRRQDARLKHYRSHHQHLASAAPIRRGMPSKSIKTDTQEATSGEGDERDIASITDFNSSSYQDSILDKNEDLTSYASSSYCSAPRDLSRLQQGSSTLDVEHSNATSVHSDDVQVADDGRFACSLCENTFQRPADLRRHMQKHEEPAYKCMVTSCGRDFYRMDKLRDHVRLAHKGDVSTTFDGSLRFEVSTEPKSTYQSHTCTHCNKVFQRKCDLNDHIFRKHERRFTCPVPHCTRSFNLRMDLRRHERAHHSHRQTLACTTAGCKREFSRRDNLLRHMKRCEQTTSKVTKPVPASVSTSLPNTAITEETS
jgi:hypothetical protein